MSLDQLQAVVTIAEEGTLVRAARRLHISQPPLTRKVRALEDELGVALFDRVPGGMRPTPAGERLLDRARGILAEVERAAVEARAAAQRTGPRGGSGGEAPNGVAGGGSKGAFAGAPGSAAGEVVPDVPSTCINSGRRA